MVNGKKHLKIAILDLNNGLPNQGMRCIRDILERWGKENNCYVLYDEFDVRQHLDIPGTEYDAYISSGGPGSPLTSEGTEWEENYFNWIHAVESWNGNENNYPKKPVFFICHSFQLACRYFKVATVSLRKSTAFGVFPVHMLQAGQEEQLFAGLKDPFYGVDSRDYQVVQPDEHRLEEMGGHVLAIEKERPHVPYERAVMALRFNEYFIGTQFHPEADAAGMSMYLQREDKKKTVIANHGEDKWKSMIEQLGDPDKILNTYQHILPNFLHSAACLHEDVKCA
jgi:GMP synthase-like glutamine amidotransferase